MSISQKIAWAVSVVILILIALFVWRFVQMANNELSNNVQDAATTTVFDTVELKSQKDFVLTGQQILDGGGFEPGWNFKLNIAGQKFGVDLVSQYGETKYVGYLDLVSQSTSTKVWGGFVLDKDDKQQNMGIKVDTQKCTEASGEEVDYTVKVLIGDPNNLTEELDGCAKLAI